MISVIMIIMTLTLPKSRGDNGRDGSDYHDEREDNDDDYIVKPDVCSSSSSS